ncbi:hypothetical protein ACFL6G_01690 [candidate division KSB1 bacterium]
MKRFMNLTFQDCLFLIFSAFFFFGCIASMHRSGKTLDAKQASFSGSYLRANNLEESDAEPVKLIALDSRLGIGYKVDIGLAHTFDISKNNDNAFNTIWGDVRIQLTNRDNQIGRPILTSGIMKGYIYDKDTKLHVTTFPFILSFPVSDRFTPFVKYRFELIKDDFIPDTFKEPRHTFAAGFEFDFSGPSSTNIIPKIGFTIGTFNSLTGGEGNRGLILNFGFILDLPKK